MTSMTEKEIHIEQLMMEKLTGLIGEEDARYLDELLQSDEEIQQQWEKIKETFERSEVHHYLQNMDTERGWMKVREGVAKSKKNRELILAVNSRCSRRAGSILFWRYSR